VFFVTILMFGLNVWAAAILMLVVCMIILHMFGCMHLLGINANAVSLVNLVMVSRVNQTRHSKKN
jgi:Niemann-Pick C1 protein